MIDQTLAEGFSAEFIRISSLVSEDLSLSLRSHQERISSASSELETGLLQILNTPVLSTHARAVSPEQKSARKKANTKTPASTTGMTKHPPTVKHSKSALKKLMDEGQVGKPTGDEDLLLNVMAESLLDKLISDKVIEDASEILG